MFPYIWGVRCVLCLGVRCVLKQITWHVLMLRLWLWLFEVVVKEYSTWVLDITNGINFSRPTGSKGISLKIFVGRI